MKRVVFRTKMVARFWLGSSEGERSSAALRMTSMAASTRSSSVPRRRVALPFLRKPPTVLILVGPG
ncbi:hypothetical protein D3C83_323500 [compost metagenome]